MNKTKNKVIGIFLTVILLITSVPINLVTAQEGVQDNTIFSYVEVKTASPIYNLSNVEVGIISTGVTLGIVHQSDDKVFFYLNDELVYIQQSAIELLDSDYVPSYEVVEDETSIELNMEFEAAEEIQVYTDSTFESLMTTIHANQVFKGFEAENNVIIIRISDRFGYIQGPLDNLETSEDEKIEQQPIEQPPSVPDDFSEEIVEQPDVNADANESISDSDENVVSEDVSPIVETYTFTSASYFEVIEDNVTIYDNSSGKLVPVGSLVKGQTYPIDSDYGSWHKIKFGNGYGYIWKEATKPATGTAINNLNSGLSNTSESFTALSNLTVYDNTSGQLVPFAVILKGESYPIISDIGNWLKIDVAGRIGYVYESSTKRPFTASDKYFEVIEDNVTIYDNSTGKLIQVGSLVKGETYPIDSDYGDWHKIKFGNGYGYIWKEATKPSNGNTINNLNSGLSNTSESFTALSNLAVYDNTSGQLVQFATILKGESYPIISDIGDWLKIDVAGRIGYVYEPSTKRPFTASDKYFEVIEDNVTIYDNSTGKLVQVGSLVKGQTYLIFSDYGDWHKIKFGNNYGYVWKEATKPSNSSALQNENKGESNSKSTFTTNGNVTVYDNTSGSLVPFAVLSNGVNYPYISTYGSDWLKVDVSGRIGYVYRPSVQLTGIIYQYTSYPITLQQMVEKQFALGAQTDKKYDAYVRQDALTLTSATSGTINGTWNVRGGAGTDYWKLGTISDGEKVTILGQAQGSDGYIWYKIKYNRTWVNASMEDIRYYVDPNNFTQGTDAYYQFLDLSKVAGVDAAEINQKVLNNKGILTGKAQSFITAASTYNINEIYLISHALLETGNGSSTLAKGVTVSSVDGQAVTPRVVYNMYGIGAVDSSPLKSGSEYAYKQGWFTPEEAIIGGAKFIAQRYINHSTYKQNTLYKMRWNPANPGTHQYATDIGWAYKQVSNISKLYSLIDTYTLHFDVPQYK